MTYELRPLTIAQLLDNTFDIYRRNFLLFLGISALPNCVLLLLQLTLVDKNPIIPRVAPSADLSEGLAVLLVAVASLFVSSIVTAATTFGVSEIYLNIPTSIRACYARVAGRVLKVGFVSFIFALITGIGLALCIIPGIYWTGKYGLAVPAVVLEDIPGGKSLDRSSQLTEGAVWRVIGITFLTAIFIAVIGFALDAGAKALESSILHPAEMFSVIVTQEVIATIISTLLNPVSAIALTLVYYDQRVRKEAFDIERMMSLLAPRDRASGAAAQ